MGIRFLAQIRRWAAGRRQPLPLGQRGEVAAAKYLRRKGYKIISRGPRDVFRGELDLVAVDGRTVVFVEVKTRQGFQAGHPADSIDQIKQERLTRAALSYLKRHKLLDQRARFDVVAVTWPPEERRPTIEHFPNAFEPQGKGQMFS